MNRVKARLRGVPGYGALSFLYNLACSPRFRSSLLLRIEQPPNLFQPFGTTLENRHPAIFRFVREQVGDGPDRRILSFGCSTGEEVFSLGSYFPESVLMGIDINPRSIAACRARLAKAPNPRLSFALAGSAVGEETESYDAVFAMSVFRHGALVKRPERCDRRIRFADFERTVVGLAGCLKPGGLLAIVHANFRFSDTAAAEGFEPVLVNRNALSEPRTPLYGRDNRLLPAVAYGELVFRKRSAG